MAQCKEFLERVKADVDAVGHEILDGFVHWYTQKTMQGALTPAELAERCVAFTSAPMNNHVVLSRGTDKIIDYLGALGWHRISVDDCGEASEGEYFVDNVSGPGTVAVLVKLYF